MNTGFLRQTEANLYVQSITDVTEHLLTEIALSRAIGAWVNDPAQRDELMRRPIDLLPFVIAVHAFFRDRAVLEGILEGKIKSLEDLDPFKP